MNRSFSALSSALLSVAVSLALPSFAQQSTSQTPPASQTASGDPLPPPRANDFWDGDEPNLVNLVSHPFASKKYVQRMTRPIADRVNELEQITANDSQTIKDIDARSQKGIQMASEKSSVADQHATDATNKAQLAQTAANDATTRVSTVEQRVSNLDMYKGTGQTEIRFRPGQTALSKPAKDALDAMAAPLKDERNYIIEVRGFAPGRGQAAIANSQKMADSIVRYLVLTHQIPVYRIYMMGVGNGSVEGTAAAHAGGPRVEVDVMRNDAAGAGK